MKITIKNDFHKTAVNVTVDDEGGPLSQSQYKKVKDKLCGMSDCRCGIVRGPQEILIQHWQDSGGRDTLYVTPREVIS